MPDRVYRVRFGNALQTYYTYDLLGRRTGEALKYNENTVLFTNTYGYTQHPTDATRTSAQVRTYGTKTGTYAYTYDNNGNITQIEFTPTGSLPARTTRYAYDELNRLIREDDTSGNGYTCVYTYDANGNIQNRAYYALTAEGVTPTGAHTDKPHNHNQGTVP